VALHNANYCVSDTTRARQEHTHYVLTQTIMLPNIGIDDVLSLLIQSPYDVSGKPGRPAGVLDIIGARKSRQEAEHEDQKRFK